MAQNESGWQRQGFIPVSRRTRENRDTEPLFTELLDSWRKQGRTLPGRPDPEWQDLVSRDFWPRGPRG
ncbi:hypothetical protein [Streptomyces sp. NPDC050560]|uniref:hypothetical protein n=1 Tax=Streptomyces sp. NPDC050560 TaxID=3365630 RepID=UPI00378D0ADE